MIKNEMNGIKCHWIGRLCQLSNHLKNDCVVSKNNLMNGQSMDCEYKMFGCNDFVSCNEMENHKQTNVRHHLGMLYVL